jgi:short-subunit dehydrogenase involved in D-alanine esterification of teichoic acids
MPAYSASKAALNSFVMCLRAQLENSGSNVKVVELWPPAVQSELLPSSCLSPSFAMLTKPQLSYTTTWAITAAN